MSLSQWKANGWLKAHVTSAAEAEELLAFVKELRVEVIGKIGTKYNLA